MFYVTSVEILNDFNTSTLNHTLWKRKIFFKKLEHCFLVESTKTENTLLQYKTAISEANFKTKVVSTKWTYHKERSFVTNYFIFRKFCFSLVTSYKELI